MRRDKEKEKQMDQMRYIDPDEFREALVKAIARTGPDHVYRRPLGDDSPNEPFGTGGCMYVDPITNQPSCLIARAMHELGEDPVSADEGLDADKVLSLHGVEDPIVREAARCAQRMQDTGHSDGVALLEYDATVDRLTKANAA